MWVLREKPELAELGRDRSNSKIISADRRMRETFMASQTGLRLMMLQANFMRALVRWRKKLDDSYGFPAGAMAAHLVELVKRIYKVRSRRHPYGAWRDFFTILQYEPIPNMSETEQMLKTAILRSKSKGYHNDAGRSWGHRQSSYLAHEYRRSSARW
ncbi:hypothetical protein L7F22_033340 [Adiantum nelumboides]|nr:hypothetical protein [Adiantum nelumboides]